MSHRNQNPKSRSQRYLPATMLVLSLICNISALSLPFLQLRKGMSSTTYTLFHSITLLWEKGLYILSFLVVGFSILFPFAKLGILFWTILSDEISATQKRWLHRVERLGKWSMLDVFLLSIILSLASQQFLVGAKPQLGLSLFIVAIMLSMTSGELISRTIPNEEVLTENPKNRNAGILLILSGLALLASIAFPFLRIEDWLLANRQYSILTLVPALWIQGAWLPSILAAAFLVITPILAWWFSLRSWRAPIISPSQNYLARLARRWSMLDVFGLALLVFALESDYLMKTEIHWGALFLGTTVVMQIILSTAYQRVATSK